MASRSVHDLTAEVQAKYLTVQKECSLNGVPILLYCTLRSCEDQAKLWRQSRTRQQVEEKAAKFKARGLTFLADILIGVGSQKGDLGKHVTMACCGESWHNYKEAFDCVPLVGGKPDWDWQREKGDMEEWLIYGKAVRKAGLVWAGDWTTFKEFPHAQLRQGSNPLKVFPATEIYNILKKNKAI